MPSVSELWGNKAVRLVTFGVLAIGLLLTCILVPISISRIEYYEYGLQIRTTTGKVDTSQVYEAGSYMNGPTRDFLRYPADAHYEELNELEVFSRGVSNESIGLEFRVDLDFTYLLQKDRIGDLHRELAQTYRGVILSRTKDAIKDEAIFISFDEYFQNRTYVEDRFRIALEKRWSDQPPLPCDLDQFHLGRIRIPDSVVEKQLEARVQNERNEEESFLQQAQIERELTAVEVNRVLLERNNILRTAQAEAKLVRARAQVEARRLLAEAHLNGTVALFGAAGIETQSQRMAFAYLRTLANRDQIQLDVSYLSGEDVVRTAPA